MKCIDFEDFGPALSSASETRTARPLPSHPLFLADERRMNSESYILRMHGRCKILGVARGWLGIPFGDLTVTVVAGQFCLLPAPLGKISVQGHGAVFLEVTPG